MCTSLIPSLTHSLTHSRTHVYIQCTHTHTHTHSRARAICLCGVAPLLHSVIAGCNTTLTPTSLSLPLFSLRFPSTPRPKVLDNVLEMIGQTPLIRINRIAKSAGLKCNLCKHTCVCVCVRAHVACFIPFCSSRTVVTHALFSFTSIRSRCVFTL